MFNKCLFVFLLAFVTIIACSYSATTKSPGKISRLAAFQNQYAEISFASSNERFLQDAKPFGQPILQQQLSGWKNERISCQVLIWAKTVLPGFKLIVADNNDNSFSKEAVHAHFLKNVAANNSGGMCGSVPKNLPEIDVPDLISNNDSTTVSPGKLQAIWITIQIPKNASAGIHTITLTPNTNQSYNLPKLTLKINVNSNVLPDANAWKFHLDLWQYPLRVAKYFNVKPWSPEHFAALKPSMQQLANAGQKAIAASFFWDNFNNENYGYDNLMVKVNGTSATNMQFDFTNFDKWVEFMMSLGIKDQIDCFGMYTFNNKFEYYITDPAQRKTTVKPMDLSSDDYNQFWTALLKAFAQHVRQKGWMDKVVLYFDERPAKNVMKVAALIKKIDPAFKIGYAGAYDPTLNSMLYDFTIPSYLKIDNDALMKRKQSNLVTTFYNTCYEKNPNLFSFSSPGEASFMGWYAFANNYDGYLRYAYDQWEKNSFTDTRSIIVPSGDKFIIYPQSYSSVRFEKLIEGIQDYEKLSLLSNQFHQSNNSAALKKINSLLPDFKINNTKNISDYPSLVEKAEQLLNSF